MIPFVVKILFSFFVWRSIANTSIIVNTIYGPIEGNITETGRAFTGIPFAAAPVNELRWMAPIAPQKWSKTLETKSVPPQCPQDCYSPTHITWQCAPTTSEDCLYVNVWTPLNIAKDSSLSVLAWIYGGSFTIGYSAGILRNGTNLANLTNTIIVTMNYRVGAMGFYYDEKNDISGNFGILDQVFAIDWIYNNIEEFGGDPNKITLFGESAGAISVLLHSLNKTTVVKNVIAESFPGAHTMLSTDVWNNGLSQQFMNEFQCSTIECLRNVPWTVIVSHQPNIVTNGDWTPTVNTTLIPIHPLFSIQRGNVKNNIAIIIGINEGEYYFMMKNIQSLSYNQMNHQFNQIWGAQTTQIVLQYYNITNQPNYNYLNETERIMTDFQFKCTARNVSASTHNTYYYHFRHITSFILNEPGSNPYCLYAACHRTERDYVFNSDLTSLGLQFTAEEQILAQQFQFYWSNFAKNSDPNVGENKILTQKWVPYSNENRQTLIFEVGDKMQIETGIDEVVCNFWDSLSYNWLFAG